MPEIAVDFSFRSARPCLDFAATLMFRHGPGPGRELLTGPVALSAWLAAAGVLDQPPAAGKVELAIALELREAIYELCAAALERRPIARRQQRLLNRMAQQPPPALRLDRFGNTMRLGDTSAGLAAIARDAVDLLGGPDLTRLRQCARPGCTRLFVDRSRGGNRCWCGMRECGNRVNAAAYRRRRRAPATRRATHAHPGAART